MFAHASGGGGRNNNKDFGEGRMFSTATVSPTASSVSSFVSDSTDSTNRVDGVGDGGSGGDSYGLKSTQGRSDSWQQLLGTEGDSPPGSPSRARGATLGDDDDDEVEDEEDEDLNTTMTSQFRTEEESWDVVSLASACSSRASSPAVALAALDDAALAAAANATPTETPKTVAVPTTAAAATAGSPEPELQSGDDSDADAEAEAKAAAATVDAILYATEALMSPSSSWIQVVDASAAEKKSCENGHPAPPSPPPSPPPTANVPLPPAPSPRLSDDEAPANVHPNRETGGLAVFPPPACGLTRDGERVDVSPPGSASASLNFDASSSSSSSSSSLSERAPPRRWGGGVGGGAAVACSRVMMGDEDDNEEEEDDEVDDRGESDDDDTAADAAATRGLKHIAALIPTVTSALDYINQGRRGTYDDSETDAFLNDGLGGNGEVGGDEGGRGEAVPRIGVGGGGDCSSQGAEGGAGKGPCYAGADDAVAGSATTFTSRVACAWSALRFTHGVASDDDDDDTNGFIRDEIDRLIAALKDAWSTRSTQLGAALKRGRERWELNRALALGGFGVSDWLARVASSSDWLARAASSSDWLARAAALRRRFGENRDLLAASFGVFGAALVCLAIASRSDPSETCRMLTWSHSSSNADLYGNLGVYAIYAHSGDHLLRGVEGGLVRYLRVFSSGGGGGGGFASSPLWR